MKFDIKDLPTTGVFMTPHQFDAIMEGQKCSHCQKKAIWFPKYERGIGYCDDHFPYKSEIKNEKNS